MRRVAPVTAREPPSPPVKAREDNREPPCRGCRGENKRQREEKVIEKVKGNGRGNSCTRSEAKHAFQPLGVTSCIQLPLYTHALLLFHGGYVRSIEQKDGTHRPSHLGLSGVDVWGRHCVWSGLA